MFFYEVIYDLGCIFLLIVNKFLLKYFLIIVFVCVLFNNEE